MVSQSRLELRFRKGLLAHSALPARAARCLAALAPRHGHHQADALYADAVDPTEVPDQYLQERRKSRYLEIDEAFIASGHALVRLDLQWPHDASNGEIASVAASIMRYARLLKLPLKVLIDSGFFQHIERQRLCQVIPHWECSHGGVRVRR
jgi:hypothetical protein